MELWDEKHPRSLILDQIKFPTKDLYITQIDCRVTRKFCYYFPDFFPLSFTMFAEGDILIRFNLIYDHQYH